MEEPLVREFLPQDIQSVLEVERSSFFTPWTEAMFRSQLRFKDRAVNLVLELDNKVVGYAASWIVAGEIHLLSIAVHPDFRRRGLGSMLLASIFERGRKRGCLRTILEVRESNEVARNFYRIHGFREIGKRHGYYADTGEDAIVMERIDSK